MILKDGDPGTRLTAAAATGNVRHVRRMLEVEGVHPDAVNKFGRTALQVMMMGSRSVAALLLEHGANANVQDQQGITPAHDAARTGFVDTLSVLHEFGASLNIPDHGGALPIHLAVREGHVDAVAFLAPRSDLSRGDRHGNTAVDLARASGSLEIVELLQHHVEPSRARQP
ncbi:cyclin-dependent kinase 4 inhibitor D-like [Scleropages formosus]|uniref:Cyclin-dependent kinase 4 inhibitor D n=1 Tax=Scleropages formosus TaxID=113540 RepID=A0A0P7XWR0_SCLFO|nr:cyclin-dependent kinase 4 inhibitor D-like [Scleropages formosus]XP_029106543.1 cyclin-dependent kinase 4 inhibitor D-like [Scleropages formosus]KPP57246.1 cyclin-dependent kinase 4 inhibitor D-like [Scleropages formosus]